MNDTPEPLVAVEPLVVKPTTAARLLDTSRTQVYELLKRGELEAIRFDADRRITMESIKRLVERRRA